MKFIIIVFVAFGFIGTAQAEETLAEKTQAAVNSAKREAKTALHRVEEAACGTLTDEGDIACFFKKVKNRLVETKDAIFD